MCAATMQIDAWVRRTAETIYHPVGSAKMGKDAESVVDAQLRVYGVEGLRVVDASVMPTLVQRQHQRADHHDRGEGGGHDPWPRTAAAEHVKIAEDRAAAAE